MPSASYYNESLVASAEALWNRKVEQVEVIPVNVMTRWLLGAAVMALGVGSGMARTEADRTEGACRQDCDLSKVDKGLWCPKCNKLVDKKDVEEGAHKECKEKVLEVLVCVKQTKLYVCGCSKCKKGCGEQSDKPGKCSCKKPLVEKAGDPDRARVELICEGCGEKGPVEKDFKHKDDCKNKKLKKHCTKSGTAPHVSGK